MHVFLEFQFNDSQQAPLSVDSVRHMICGAVSGQFKPIRLKAVRTIRQDI